jgi:DNA mismatch endonuclease (patch repair protein)
MDILTRIERSRLMARIKGKNTTPELAVRRAVHSDGYRYRLHGPDLPGRPDLVFPSRKKAIFVHGCFWHAHDCDHGRRRPVTNRTFWARKARENRRRDERKLHELQALGWRVLLVWECEIKRDLRWLARIRRFLGKPGRSHSGRK